ncbi:gametogenetin-binding protein 2-like [Daphnia pulicaria]|uniref:gametogenetin-binding protein 2-like n=1 Tax=Daphnia pulicaria TaxID=35523 RepID=UPI001EEA8743|nr:gametogenetin-binding protein 2-like [Daphnia pulicaria]
MARLISLYRDDAPSPLGRRELPLPFDENISMVMKLPELNLTRLPSCLKGSENDAFVDKRKLLTVAEMNDSMKVSSQEVLELIGPNVPCVGCRRSVERLFHELVASGQDALYPVTLSPSGSLGLAPEVISSSSKLFILLKYYGSRLSTMAESITTKSRQNRRCPLHSLDAHRARPSGVNWRPLWDSMAQECREELTLVEANTLLDTLEAYLQKHRFCPECRLKVLRAYSLLVGEVEPTEEKGYKPLLYLGLKCCPAEKHIHVQCNADLMSLLIARAEPELVGSFRRERHAKTMEVAQEEVVTCVGICLLERLQRVAQRLREEEQMVDMLQFASLQALRRSFEMAVESKRGVSQLELLCEELSREEAAQKQRKEAKKQKRKKRRGKKDSISSSDNICRSEKDYDNEDDVEEDADEEILPALVPPPPTCHRSIMESSRSPSRENCPCSASDAKHSSGPGQAPFAAQPSFVNGRSRKCPQESGYSSTNSSNLTTPEGSDVACTEGLCNHHSGSPVQCRPSPSPVPEGLSEDHCNCDDIEYENPETRANLSRASRCPIHIRLRENCRNGRSLQQMLEEWHVNSDDDDEGEEGFIPLEEVQAFRKQQQHYNEQRRQLRNDLRLKFDQLCGRVQNQSQ